MHTSVRGRRIPRAVLLQRTRMSRREEEAEAAMAAEEAKTPPHLVAM